jgi:hypothetical protein
MSEEKKPSTPALIRRYRNHAYLNPDGTVDGERLLNVVKNAPGAFNLISLNKLIERGAVAADYHWTVSEIVEGLTRLVMLAARGDERSATQIKAIEKLINPEKYELPQNKIKELVERYETSPPLARGWELRRLMSLLAFVVQPLKKDGKSSENQPIKLRDNPPDFYVHLTGLARKHWKPNTTLQSMAIRIYLEELQEKGITDEGEAITDRSLKRDLAKVREWERNASEDEKVRRGQYKGLSLSDDPITWYEFSEGWKSRRMKRAESEKGGKKRGRLT